MVIALLYIYYIYIILGVTRALIRCYAVARAQHLGQNSRFGQQPPRGWPRATPDFGSVRVISSFLLSDIPRHPDTRLFEVREAFKRSLLVFRRIFAHIPQFFRLRRPSEGPPGGDSRGAFGGLARLRRATRLASPVAMCATDAEPLID